MMKYLLFVPLALLTITGCSGGGDNGDVAAAENAAKLAPKSKEDLPASMPPQAQKSAEAAMGAQKAMADQMAKNPPPQNLGK